MSRNKLSEPEKLARYQISKNLKLYSKGLTQRQLSEKTGIPASTLSGYFAQRSTPNAGTLEKIATALHVQKSDIDPRYKLSHKPAFHVPLSELVDNPKPNSKKEVDIENDPVILSYGGRPVSDEDMKIIKAILERHNNE